MKMRTFGIIVLCILLMGCGKAATQQEQSTETIFVQPIETVPVQTVAAEQMIIEALPDTTMESLEDAIVHVSIEQNGFFRDDAGNVVLRMQVYSYEKFDMVDIAAMKTGDIIQVSGEKIVVNSLERKENGTVLVNGGLDEGGFDLATDDSGIYFLHGYSDMKTWNLLGEVEYPVSDDFVFIDSADLDRGEVTYTAADLVDSVPDFAFGYQPQNTTVCLENGRIEGMERVYTP